MPNAPLSVLTLWLTTFAVAPAWSDNSLDEIAIPPGQEQLLGTMLGHGAELSDRCRLSAAGIEYTLVKATYICPGGPVQLELNHPSKAESRSLLTNQFALTVIDGDAPAGLTSSLVSLVRRHESEFTWIPTTLVAEPADEVAEEEAELAPADPQ